MGDKVLYFNESLGTSPTKEAGRETVCCRAGWEVWPGREADICRPVSKEALSFPVEIVLQMG